jgi:hypothetical protein
MYGIHTAAVIQIMGPHAHHLRGYGVNPEEDASTAVELNARAQHLARLLRGVATS